MRALGGINILGAACLFLVYKCTVAVCQEDESTVEIVLFNNGTGKVKSRETMSERASPEDKSKELKSLLTTLLSHLLSSSKLRNSFLKSQDGDAEILKAGGSGGQGAGDHREDDAKGKSSGPEQTRQQPGIDRPRPDVLEKIKRIPIGYKAFCALVQNTDLIRDKLRNRPGIGRIRNVVIYEGYHLTDYWGRLKFKKEGDTFVDETGYFEGVKVNAFEDVLKQGRMTKTGFVQKKDIGEAEVDEGLTTIRLLLNEIAKEKNTSIHNVIDEKCNMSLVEELVFYGNSPSAHNDETVNICICSDSFCKEPCKEILPMKVGELQFKG